MTLYKSKPVPFEDKCDACGTFNLVLLETPAGEREALKLCVNFKACNTRTRTPLEAVTGRATE